MTTSLTTLPVFFDPAQASKLYLPRYQQIMDEAMAYRKNFHVTPGNTDTKRVAVFAIDMQVGFCTPGASLFVPGATEDVVRGAKFILQNVGKISELHYSLDTHRAFQIFHPTFWVNANGNHPNPFTLITSQDIRDGKWLPISHLQYAVDYVKQLEDQGKYTLAIWPFHTMLGAIDHSLVPLMFETALFHSIVRQTQTKFETKGEHPLTENYSVLSSEVKTLRPGSNQELTVGNFNTKFFDTLMRNDEVYIIGEASSHCVKATIEDLLHHIQAVDPALVNKVTILQDCMSPVGALPTVDFPAIAAQALRDFETAGFTVMNSTDVVL